MAEHTNKELLTLFGVVFLGIPAIIGLLGLLFSLYQTNQENQFYDCVEGRNPYRGIVVETELDFYRSEYGKYYALEQCKDLRP